MPVLGNDAKLVPNNGKMEVRAKGPNVTPGYWRQPDLTAKAFDEEGFYKFGDALKPAIADDFDAGFDFDGRISEDFKLASGTWVSVGPPFTCSAPSPTSLVMASCGPSRAPALPSRLYPSDLIVPPVRLPPVLSATIELRTVMSIGPSR